MRRLISAVFLLTAGLVALLAGALPAAAAPAVVPPVINLASSVNPSVVGQAVTFTASVTQPGGPAPAGLVTFTCTCMATTTRPLVAISTTTSTASVIQGFSLPGSYTISVTASVTNIDTGPLTASLIQHVDAATPTATPTVTPSITPTVTPTRTVMPTATPTVIVTVPGAVQVPVGAVGTGGGGSLDGGPSVVLLAAGSGLILAGAGTAFAAWRRKRAHRS